jgi:maltose/moltooligosaccharide transporter
MFCYWQYLTSCLSLSLYNTTDQASPYFAQAQLLTGNLNGTYNIVCVFVAFAMIPIARHLGAKVLHCISLIIGGIGLLMIPNLSDQVEILSISNPFGSGKIIISQIYIYAVALGITWASMMSMPYQIVAKSIPKNKMGVYMGIFNMFIVIPMIIQIITIQFGLYDLLGENPINVVLLGGVFLILGGLSSLRIDQK